MNIVCKCGHPVTSHKNNGCNFIVKEKSHGWDTEFCDCDITDRELLTTHYVKLEHDYSALLQAAKEVVESYNHTPASYSLSRIENAIERLEELVTSSPPFSS